MTSVQEIWRTGDIHWPMNEDARIDHCVYINTPRTHKEHLILLLLLCAGELQIPWLLRCSDKISLPMAVCSDRAGPGCSWTRILSKNIKSAKKVISIRLEPRSFEQCLHSNASTTSPPQQDLHSNPIDRPQAASGLQLQRFLHIRPALAARSAPAHAPSQPAAAG